MFLVIHPTTFVLCPITLVPSSLPMFISFFPQTFVLNDELLLPFTPNGSCAFTMLQTI